MLHCNHLGAGVLIGTISCVNRVSISRNASIDGAAPAGLLALKFDAAVWLKSMVKSSHRGCPVSPI